jgi:hypothetical protein
LISQLYRRAAGCSHPIPALFIIPGVRPSAHPGMTASRARYDFKCLAKNSMLRGQAMSALALS